MAKKQTAIAVVEPTPAVHLEVEITVGYWRAKCDSAEAKCGDLGCVTDVDVDGIDVCINGHSYCYQPDEFITNYEAAPDGAAERAKEMAALMGEISRLGSEQTVALKKLAVANPHIGDEGDVAGQMADPSDDVPPAPDELVHSTSLVAAAGVTPLALKKSAAGVRNLASRFGKEVKVRQERLQVIVKEQAAMLAAQAKQMQKVVGKLEEAIWTINLYLGTNETIVRLSKGQPAPQNSPIVLRQLVLFMDEECAVAADEGGIDACSIEEFDKWITAPLHLQQVLPDAKGVVAIKVRRNMKDYHSPWINKEMDEANSQTYFLMRNGKNVYRMCTSFNVGASLFPTEEEMLATFTEREWDGKAHQYVNQPIRPGGRNYMKALELADAERRHYLRVGIILQGLIDRTPIFKPLPIERLNVCNPSQSAEFLRFIRDGEAVLGDGRPSFHDWLVDVNGKLNVGSRIMGIFSNWTYGIRDKKRVWPSNADRPDDETIYTVEKKGDKKGSFYFYYSRGEIWTGGWSRYEQKEAEVRARCTVLADDDFILNFDEATVEDMEGYIASRINRHDYEHMFPLLKRAIKLKKAEEAEEAPFKQLLAGMLLKRYRLDLHVAEAAVPELVRWWKFKNQTHRALTSNDVSAIKMIVAEFGVRQKRAAERADVNGVDAFGRYVVGFILERHPTAALIAHKSGNEWVSLIPMNDENVWVKEQIWKSNRSSSNAGDKLRLVEEKEWTLVDKRRERWQTLHQSDRWPHWTVDARRQDWITDPEREQIIKDATVQLQMTP